MKKTTLFAGALLLGLFMPTTAKAQLSKNPDKFLGNITTRGSVNGGGYEYKTKWNQLTCENETKWSSVQGGGPNSWNWGGADNAYNYCKTNGLLFKFHCLAWGSQYPSWIESLSYEERYNAIVKWMDAVKKRYPDIKMFDVVNEAVQGHQSGTHYFEEALGGKGVSGWDWIINAFELAHERWPDAILIYNDFNTFQWQRTQFIELCTALRDYGAPIDAYGCQSHDLTGYSLSNFKTAMNEIQSKLKMPMYSTEYDIGTYDDQQQLTNYKEQIPYMWEQDYFAGLTLWGSTYGATWTDDGNSGILNKNGKNRPAYDWLVEYMASEKAQTAKSPFPGMKKQVDFYIKPMAPKLSMAEPGKIDLRARMIDKTRKIERIDFYANNQLYCTLTEAPWVVEYTPGKQGSIPLKAVLTADDGQQYTRYGNVNVVAARTPYGTYNIPGTVIQAENFDKGVEGSAFHDTDYTNSGNNSYRSGLGVDISTGNSGKVVSYTEDGEWLEYTVNVKEDGYYSYEVTATSGVEGAAVSFSVKEDSAYVKFTDDIEIPCIKKNAWTTYKAVYGRTVVPLTAGKKIIRLNIEKGGAYIDKFTFKKVNLNEELNLDVALSQERMYQKDTVQIMVNTDYDAAKIQNVCVYVNNVMQKKFNEVPCQLEYVPAEDGIYEVMAYAIDTLDNVSAMFTKSLRVDKKRLPYKDTYAELPGVIEAENFDVMGEGYSFHDTDNVDEGGSKYRTDNEGVDIYKGASGYYVTAAKNEWMDYSVDVKQPGIYDVALTVATNTERGQYQLFLVDEDGNETAITGKKYIAAYKNLSSYKDVKTTTTEVIPQGRQVLRLKATMGFNIDKMTFAINEEQTATGIAEVIVANRIDTYAVYTIDGAFVGNFRATSTDDLSRKAKSISDKRGTYVIKNITTGEAKNLMVK